MVSNVLNFAHPLSKFCLTPCIADLPTFYEIKAEDLPPFGKKTQKIFMLEQDSNILSAGDTE